MERWHTIEQGPKTQKESEAEDCRNKPSVVDPDLDHDHCGRTLIALTIVVVIVTVIVIHTFMQNILLRLFERSSVHRTERSDAPLAYSTELGMAT